MPGFELTKAKENRDTGAVSEFSFAHRCTHISNHTVLIFIPQGLHNNKNTGTLKYPFKTLCSEAEMTNTFMLFHNF